MWRPMKHLMKQEKPRHDEIPEQMAMTSEKGESACAEEGVRTDSDPAESDDDNSQQEVMLEGENVAVTESPNEPLSGGCGIARARQHAQLKFFLIVVVGSVVLVIVCAFLVIYADALASRGSEPLHSVPPCPPDWTGFRGMCYYFSKEKRNWTSSQSFCSSQKASLLTFNPSLEKDFVMLHKGKAPFWIGLRREPHQPWKWTNGENSTLEIIGEGQCVYLDNEATPISLRCRTELFWICQKAEAKLKGKK